MLFLKKKKTKVGCYCPVCLNRVETVSIKDFNPDENVVGDWSKRHCRYNCGHSKNLKLGQLFLYLFSENEGSPSYACEFENVEPSIKERAPDKAWIKKYGNKKKLLASVEEVMALKPKALKLKIKRSIKSQSASEVFKQFDLKDGALKLKKSELEKFLETKSVPWCVDFAGKVLIGSECVSEYSGELKKLNIEEQRILEDLSVSQRLRLAELFYPIFKEWFDTNEIMDPFLGFILKEYEAQHRQKVIA